MVRFRRRNHNDHPRKNRNIDQAALSETITGCTQQRARLSDHILNNHWKRPWANANTLSNAIRRQLRKAGCVGLVMHGLRATAASELAENRAGVKGIMSVTGHKTPHMALYYCALADQGRINENTVEIWDDALERKAKAKPRR